MLRESSMVVPMLRKCCLFSAVAFCGLQTVTADTIQLKEKAAITGKILSEKRDQVAVDVGYTVLVIPRNQIAHISKTDDADPPTKPAVKPAVKPATTAGTREVPEAKPGFYSAPTKAGAVRHLGGPGNLIGEAGG